MLLLFLVILLRNCELGTASSGGSLVTRFWIDYLHQAHQREVQLLRDRMLSLPRDEVQVQEHGEYGFDKIGKWDVYFSHRLACQETLARQLRPLQHQVDCVPGLKAILLKAQLFKSLRSSFGAQLAAAISPSTFDLPHEYFQLASHVHSKGAPPAVVLKAENHRGKGVSMVPAKDALLRALHQQPTGQANEPILAQRLILDQIIMKGAPLKFRVWIVVCGPDPVRTYMFKGANFGVGKQLFRQADAEPDASESTPDYAEVGVSSANCSSSSRHQSQPQQRWQLGHPAQPHPGGAVLEGCQGTWDDLILNPSRSTKEEYLKEAHRLRTFEERVVPRVGRAALDAMWRQLELEVAATVAAAVPKMRREGRIFAAMAAGFTVADEEDPDLSHVPEGLPGDLGGFQVLGADVALDSRLKPWILEVNVPSTTYMIRPEDASKFNGGRPHEWDLERQDFLDALVQLLLSRHRSGAQALASAAQQAAAEEEQRRWQAEQDGWEASMGKGSSGWVPPPAGLANGNLSTRAIQEATVWVALKEAATAAAHNFSVLTPLVYQALECMESQGAGREQQQSPPCPVLQELLQPPASVPPCTDWAAVGGVCAGRLHLVTPCNRTHIAWGECKARGQGAGVWALLSSLLSSVQQGLATVTGVVQLPAFQWGAPERQKVQFAFSKSDELFLAAMQQAAG